MVEQKCPLLSKVDLLKLQCIHTPGPARSLNSHRLGGITGEAKALRHIPNSPTPEIRQLLLTLIVSMSARQLSAFQFVTLGIVPFCLCPIWNLKAGSLMVALHGH